MIPTQPHPPFSLATQSITLSIKTDSWNLAWSAHWHPLSLLSALFSPLLAAPLFKRPEYQSRDRSEGQGSEPELQPVNPIDEEHGRWVLCPPGYLSPSPILSLPPPALLQFNQGSQLRMVMFFESETSQLSLSHI